MFVRMRGCTDLNFARRCFMPVSCSSKFHQFPEAFWERIQPLLPNYKNQL
ncbi:hypothetical protein SAMN05421753_1311 [Planctomicrobium piriforme]|uniref:Uncharacterized protein n=1 Tax=Planctomicrobium piriforme TaxID=1576369 RepID=A0A1I3TLZ9_9PLAN|nr:hypothetical protein SAMN05421753_1311 [Planctomicrobium piriforme]